MITKQEGRAPNTVPRALTQELREFCASISPSEPSFITSIAISRAKTSFCFANVGRRVREKGGSIAYGWAIWHQPGLYFEAEHHAVWRNRLGNLIDVSPQMGGRKRLLFLPDEAAVYDPLALRRNIIVPDGASERALRMTELGIRRQDLIFRCRISGTAEIQLHEHDQIELADIERQIQRIMRS